MLELYRRALRIRRAEPALSNAAEAPATPETPKTPETPEAPAGSMTWLPAADGVLAFSRGDGVARGDGVLCVANLSPGPVELPAHAAVLLASGPLTDGLLPPDTAAWLRTSRLIRRLEASRPAGQAASRPPGHGDRRDLVSA